VDHLRTRVRFPAPPLMHEKKMMVFTPSLQRATSLEVSTERSQYHPLKPHAVNEWRHCSLNSMRKAGLGKWSQASDFSPTKVNHAKCEMMGRWGVAQVNRRTEGKSPMVRDWETNRRDTPLHWWRAGGTGCEELTVESSYSCRTRDDKTTTETRMHKGTGAVGAVRVAHSSRSVGKLHTRRRGGRDQRTNDVRKRR